MSTAGDTLVEWDLASHGLVATTGPHQVGRLAFDLLDEGREDPYARRPGTPRRLAVWVWYPAASISGRSSSAYLPGAWRTTSWLWGLHATRLRTQSFDAAEPAPGPFPLVVFSPSANPPHCYAGLLQELASHGYIVAGISHTYECMPLSVFAEARPRLARLASLGGALAAPGKRPYATDLRERAEVVATKADDMIFVRDALINGCRAKSLLPEVDGGRVAVIGHSFGGGAALEVCQGPEPPRAGASLDGGLWRTPKSVSPSTPFLQLFGEHPEYAAAPEEAVRRGFYKSAEYAAEDQATTVGAWQALHANAKPGYSALVRGATHTSFCDWPMLSMRKWSPARRALQGVEGPAVWGAVAGALLAVLGVHVVGSEGDVSRTLASSDRLMVGEPSRLFTAAFGGRAQES